MRPTHVIARRDGRLVGHAVWSARTVFMSDGSGLESAYVDAVATEPDLQRRGIGSAVIQRLNREIDDYEVGCLSTERVSFYEGNGWELWAGPKGVKLDDGIDMTPEQRVMIRRTRRTPMLDLSSLLVITPRRGEPW